jgi:MFS transporter, DHA2 family, multidrug resistance protein
LSGTYEKRSSKSHPHRDRIAHLTSYFTAHGAVDAAAAHHQALVALGKIIRRQSLILGFSDTFAVLGLVLVFAAALVDPGEKGHASGVEASRSLCP